MPTQTFSEVQYLVSTNMTALNDADHINTTDTAVVVDDASDLQVGQIITLDSEDMKITDINTNTLTVTRAQNGTTAASHNDNTVVSSEIWTAIQIAGTTTPAVLSVQIDDTYLSPRRATIVILNNSTDPTNDTASTAKGPFTDIFTDFMRVRIRESVTKRSLFYGLIYQLEDRYDKKFGMVIQLVCYDPLALLADKDTVDALGFTIDISENVNQRVVPTTSTINNSTRLWSQAVSARTGLIGSMLAVFSPNYLELGGFGEGTIDRLGATLGVTSGTTNFYSDHMFTHSVQKFFNSGAYRLSGKNKKTVLKHIQEIASTEPTVDDVAWAGTSTPQVYGFDYYAEPYFNDVKNTYDKSPAFFNYFVRGTRPNSAIDSTPSHGLTVEQPTKGTTFSGQVQAIHDFNFSQPKTEVYTEAIVKYRESSTVAGGIQSSVKNTVVMEMLEINAWANPTSFACTPNDTANTASVKNELNISNGKGVGEAQANTSEWLEVDIGSSTYKTIARIQMLDRTSGTINDANPAYVLISEIQPEIDTKFFLPGTVWRGKTNTSSTFTIKSRITKQLDGISKPLRVNSAYKEPRAIREQVASLLLRSRTSSKRGRFTVYDRPEFYFDNSPSAVATATLNSIDTQTTITLSGFSGTNPSAKHGFRAGHSLVKLDSDGNLTTTYGNAFNVFTHASTGGTVQVILNTGSITTDDTVRYYVPVRAGDLVYVKNAPLDIAGKFIVTNTKYMEEEGVSYTSYNVVEYETDISGDFAPNLLSNFASKVELDEKASDEDKDLAEWLPDKPLFTGVFYVDTNSASPPTDNDGDKVSWSAGTLTFGNKTVDIDADNTGETDVMIDASAGNTSQSARTLNAGVEYIIYYPGSGSVFKCIRKAAYRNAEDDNNLIVASCSAETETGTGAKFEVYVDIDNSKVQTGAGHGGDGTIKFGGTPFNVTADRIAYGAILNASGTGALENPNILSGLGSGALADDDKLLIWDTSSSSWAVVALSDLKTYVNA